MKNKLLKAIVGITVCVFMTTSGFAQTEFDAKKFNEEKFQESWVMPTLPKVHVGGNQYNLYVSENGDDSNDGSISSPLKTITGARNKIRELKKINDFSATSVYVNIRGGIYSQDGFELTAEDSGMVDYPITYRAYKDEKVSVIGGANIPASSWSLVDDEATLKRLPEEARGKVYKANMADLGYTREQIGEMKYYGQYNTQIHQPDTPSYPIPAEIYCDGEAQMLSRYPNEGFILINKVVKNTIEWWWNMTGPVDMTRDKSGFIVKYEGDRHDRWVTADQAKMYGMWRFDWCDSTVDIKNIDTKNKTIEGSVAVSRGVKAHDGIGGRYYVYNLLEEIDVPGEYFLDRNDLTMYYYPKKDLSTCTVDMSVSLKPVIKVTNAKNIVIEGLNISVSRDCGVKIVDSENVNVNNCSIFATSADGVYISNCENSGVTNSEIYNTEGGISLYSYCGMTGGTAERAKLNHSRNYAINNKLHDCARMSKINVRALNIFGVGNYVAHNEIYNGDHIAILVNQANDNIIEYNDIHHVLMDTSDAGVIYIAGGWEIQNTVIRYNYIHDNGTDQPNLHAFYPDGGASGTRIYGNIVKDIGSKGTAFMSCGRNHTVANNIWINMGDASMKGNVLKAPLYGEATHNDIRRYINKDQNPDADKWLDRWPWLQTYLDPTTIGKLTDNNVYNNINIDGPGVAFPEAFFEYGNIHQDIMATKEEIPYSVGENGKFNINQETIKAKISDWEYIDTAKIGIVDEYKRTSNFDD